MTEHTQPQALAESISALMDNEVTELELLRLLKASEADADLKATWSRYQMASAALRNDLPIIASLDFANKVAASVEAEVTYGALNLATTERDTRGEKIKRGWQQMGRVAIAASVAGALIIGVQQYESTNSHSLQYVQVSVPAVNSSENKAADLPSGINAPALSARTVAVQSGYEFRPQENRGVMFIPRSEVGPVNNDEISTYVNSLINEHSDNAALNSGQGILPFTRIILTEGE